MTNAMPTQSQMDQAVAQAVSAYAEMMGLDAADVVNNHKDQVFQLVCAYAAQV